MEWQQSMELQNYIYGLNRGQINEVLELNGADLSKYSGLEDKHMPVTAFNVLRALAKKDGKIRVISYYK